MKQGRRARERRKNIIAVALIAVFALVVLGVNAAGEFVAQKVILPFVQITEGAEATVTRQVSVERLTLYVVSCGTFASSGEAESTRAACRANGGGAFLWQDDGVMRVVDSCYLNKDAALLRRQAQETAALLTTQTGGLTLRLTGSQEQTEACISCLNTFSACVREVLNTAEQTEAGAMSRPQASSALQACEATLKERQSELNALASGHAVVLALREGYIALLAALHERPAASADDYFPALRYMACAAGHSFFAFCAALTG